MSIRKRIAEIEAELDAFSLAVGGPWDTTESRAREKELWAERERLRLVPGALPSDAEDYEASILAEVQYEW